jgi:hypothetical protein
MNKAVALTIAAIFCSMPGATVAFAQTATVAMTDDMVTIVNVEQSGTDNDNSLKQIPAEIKSATPEAMTNAQAEVQKDAALMAILQKKNVTVTNVVGMQTAANGGKIIYVK